MTQKNSATSFRYSRKDRKEVLAKYPEAEYIVLLKGPQKYWTYDEDAQQIAVFFNAPLYKTKKGSALVFDLPLHGAITAVLETRQLPYITVYPKKELVCSGPFTVPAPDAVIKFDTVFVLKNSSGESTRYKIVAQTPYEMVNIVHSTTRTTELIQSPLLQDGDATLIPAQAPIVTALIGKSVGDSVDVEDDDYYIAEIVTPS